MPETLERLNRAVAGVYAVEREIGQGGMATVYLARDLRHDRRVALKLLRAELGAVLGVERFQAEIRVTASLQHPNLLPLFDSGGSDGMLFYVMPFVEGESLRHRLDREKQLPVDEAVRIATAVAGALDYAHSHGVIHRDLKPENILLQHGQPVVADFGIALAISNAGGARVTQTGLSLGTPQYMSPEQATGDRVIDARTDIYSLGSVLYEMLTGDPPHTGSTAQAIIARVLTERPRSVHATRPSVPEHVELAIERALEKLPADRFATAAAFAEALGRPDSAASRPTTSTRALTASPSSPAPTRRQLVAIVLPWALVAVLGAAVAARWLRAPSPPPPVVRLTIPLPGVTLRSDNSPVISLDGSMLAFPGVDSTRTVQFYLRSLDNERPLSVAGDHWDPNTAFFSPDGKWIGFLQGAKLRKVAVAGGAISIIADVPGAWALGSWGTRDTIVYGRNGDLYTVAAAGGEPRLLVARDSGVVRYGSPHFLPDGRRFLAERVTADGPRLMTGSIDDTVLRELPLRGQSPHYVDGGWLVYVEPNGRVVAAAFDERTLRVTGAAIPIAENVFIDAHARLTVSRNGTIAYYTGRSAANHEVMLIDPGGLPTTLPVPPNLYWFPRFSPDGSRIALIAADALDNAKTGDVWTYDLTTRRAERLTFDSTATGVEWTPDGRSLLYVSRLERRGTKSVFRIPATGGGEPQRIIADRIVANALITPSGDSLVFREQTNQTWDILLAPLSNPARARPLVATAFVEGAPTLSPNGEWLAYASNLSGDFEVYVQPVRGRGARWRVSASGGAEPRWGENGTTLFYRQRDTVYAVPLKLGAEVRVGDARAVVAGSYISAQWDHGEVHFDVTRDGRRFVMVRELDRTAGTTLHLVLNWFEHARDRR